MGTLVDLNARICSLQKLPVNLWSLRWRIITRTGMHITSAWLPETEYPSIKKTLHEFAGHVEALFIDGRHNFEKQSATFLRCPGDALASLSYKMLHSALSGRQAIIGIEVEDVEGTRYLVLRDGNVHIEERKGEHVANDN